MSDERWQRQWDLFHQALEHLPQERAEFLREACGADEELLEQVRELLDAHARSSGVLEATEAVRAGFEQDLKVEELVGESIGPYRLEAVLGVGGMGVVYAAQQDGPIRRRVALKLIKLGMDSGEIVSRFESERQALAILNHPGIAKVFDAGVTDQGRSYFVMEYVPGIAITEYCDLRGLGLPERLDLFRQACAAIEHAHRQGIIHRDLKPSNILVASVDGKSSLKIIDFGVAKAVGSSLTDRGSFTQHGMIIGTPEYMSPEQAGTTALEVDTRTDVYALGVLLYELLVGALPFDPTTLRRAAAMEMLRIIREEEPPKPSVRLISLGEARQDIARRRHLDPRTLVKKLQGELEWITMRALEKDPDRRYASASAFGEDVARFLDGRAVEAGPPSNLYLLQKLFHRHRRATIAAGVIVVLLTAFGVQSRRAARLSGEQAAVRGRLEAVLRSAETKGMTVQRVWQGDMMGQPSPDGRYLSYVDWMTGNVAVHDFDTDEDRNLTDDGTWDAPQRYPDISAWSPDSRYLAYTWFDDAWGADLRIVDLKGKEPRVLYHAPDVGIPFPQAWSKDGKSILALYNRTDPSAESGHEDQIALIDVADGSMRVLKSLGRQHTRNMDLSPDGRWVVYELQAEPGKEQRDLFLISTDGQEVRLADHVSDDWAPHWTPDGTQVLFVSGRSGEPGLWKIAVVDGKPAGEAEPVKLGLERGLASMGMTRNGDYWYGTGRLDLDVHVVEVDVEQGRVLSPPAKQASRFDGANTWPFWSADGERLGYLSSRATEAGPPETAIVIRTVATGEERDLEVPGVTVWYTPGGWAPPSFDPGGQSLLAVGRAPDSSKYMVHIDVATGRARPLLDADARPLAGHWATFSADGRLVFFAPPDKYEIRAYDLQRGVERVLHRSDRDIHGLAPSPDGRQIAFLTAASAMEKPRRLEVLDLTEGTVELLLEVTGDEEFEWGPALTWTPDGRFLLFGRRGSSEEAIELWRMPITGGRPARVMTFPAGWVQRLSIHPDGRRIAFGSGKPTGGNIWVLRGIHSSSEKDRGA